MKNISTFMKGFLIAFLLLFAAVIQSNAQKKLSIQGFLKDGNGKAVDNGNYELTFKIYDVANAGTALWTEAHPAVKVYGGVYSVNLGEITSLDLLPFDKPYFVGITVANTEFTPRIELTYAPYALAVAGISGYNGSAKFASNGSFSVTSTGTNLALGTGSFDVTSKGSTMDFGTGALNISSASTYIGMPNASVSFSAAGNTDLNLKNSTFNVNGQFRVATTGNQLYDGTAINFRNTSGTDKFFFNTASGRMGIGTTTPLAALDIRGTQSSGTAYGYGIAGTVSSVFTVSGGVSALVNIDGNLMAQAVVVSSNSTFSDKRFKNVFGLSNSSKDLDLLGKIKITDYEYIDKIRNSKGVQKKIIAQELEEVLPTAVQKNKSVIPSVYESAETIDYNDGILSLSTTKNHGFQKGDEVDILTTNEDLIKVEVLEVVDAHTFKIKADEKPEGAFVYGKWVNDARAVDYEAISMLNVSATQELHKQIKALQEENSKLLNQNKQLLEITSKIESRLEKLENNSNNRGVSKDAATGDR